MVEKRLADLNWKPILGQRFNASLLNWCRSFRQQLWWLRQM